MSERPILFNDEMVRATLDGRKTQTRRPVKPQPAEHQSRSARWNGNTYEFPLGGQCGHDIPKGCPFGVPGDRLWVREAWYYRGTSHTVGDDFSTYYAQYALDGARQEVRGPKDITEWPPYQRKPKNFAKYLSAYPEDMEEREEWAYSDFLHDWWRKKRPPRHMPRWASRLTLRVKRVWVERVQEISEEDAAEEGVEPDQVYSHMLAGGEPFYDSNHASAFVDLWNSVYAARGLGWDANPWVWCCEFEMEDR